MTNPKNTTQEAQEAQAALERMALRETTRLVERVRENCVRLLGQDIAGRAMMLVLHSIERTLRAGRQKTEQQLGVSLEPKPRRWWWPWRKPTA